MSGADDEWADVIVLDDYREKKSDIRKKIEELEDMSSEVYSSYTEEEQIGYERFKKLLELLELGEYEPQETDDEEE